MDTFNEEEIQKKIEEKRKRFIENAHRALGFYDHNMLNTSDEHKKKRVELIEQEFNKVFDNQSKAARKYDEEPSKPLILASSSHSENVSKSKIDESPSPSIKSMAKANVEKREVFEPEDSLERAKKEHDSKLKPALSAADATTKESDRKVSSTIDSPLAKFDCKASLEEEKKVYSHDETLAASQKKAIASKSKKMEYYDEQIDSDDENSSSHQYIQSVPVVAKSKKLKKFVVNTRHCRQERETLQYVIDLCRWYETTSIGEGNLIWYGVSLRDCDIDIIRSKPKVYFNRYPGSELLARKKILCNIMNRMEKYFGEEYEFTPLSYMLPEEEDLLDEDMIKYKDMWYIAKPSKGCGGDGIFLVNRITDIPRWHSTTELLVQHYITDPLLVDKKKFDMRVYVLVAGLDPLECYLCTEGMARLCTENYKAPDRSNRRCTYMHLTNFSLNKNSAKYSKGEGEEGNGGSKRLLSKVLDYLEKEQGVDKSKIYDQIRDTVSKTIIGLIPYLADFARISINPNIDQLRCFQIFGFDIMIDKKYKAWLLEVNANPSLNMYLDKELPNGDLERTLCDLDKYLKSMVMQDAINIVISKKSPEKYGCFEKILPTKDTFYDQFYIWEEARKIFERLGGVKSPEFISSSQFQRLGKLRGMTNGKIVKASYDIMYKNVVNRSDSKQMAMEHFFDALEILAAKLFKKETMYESLNELIETVKDQHI